MNTKQTQTTVKRVRDCDCEAYPFCEHAVTDSGKSPSVKTIADLQDGPYHLLQDSQDVRACLESIGKLDELNDTGCLFAEIGEGEYVSVYQCSYFVPVLTHRVYQLL